MVFVCKSWFYTSRELKCMKVLERCKILGGGMKNVYENLVGKSENKRVGALYIITLTLKVKLSHYKPGQALGVSGG